LLCPYRENEVYGENFIQPPPDIEEEEEVYKVGTNSEAQETWMRL
jgi:hypothetical protein